MFYPIYQYWYNGEMREYKSSFGSSRHKAIGTNVTIVMDEKGNVYEKGEMKSNILFGIIFAAVGIGILIGLGRAFL